MNFAKFSRTSFLQSTSGRLLLVIRSKLSELIIRETDVLIIDEKVLATLINKYFVNITADLDLKRDSEILSDTSTSVSSILERFHCRQSILKIQEAFNTPDNFSFHEVREDEKFDKKF